MNESDWEYDLYDEDWMSDEEFVPDEWFDQELADESEHDHQDTSAVHFAYESMETEWDELISPEFREELVEYAEIMNQDTEGMSPEEAEKYMEFAWGALIGPLVSALAPVAIKAVGGLINKGSRKRRNRRQPSRQSRTSRSPQPQRRSVPPQRSTGAARSALQALTSLLQNPQLIQALTRLASSRESQLTMVGPENTPIREGAILNAIAEYAREASMEFAQEHHEDGEDYLKDQSGEYLTDPSYPELRAEQLLDLISDN